VSKTEKPSTSVEYSSNNSGGRWWLTDDDWLALEKAGWKVSWFRNEDRKYFKPDEDGRWLGALASNAIKPGAKSLREAADEWERVTGKSATDAGCACCGQPHSFTLYVDGKWTESGPETSYSASW
jgi:hypothetical protein